VRSPSGRFPRLPCCAPRPARAQETTLRLHHFLPAVSNVHRFFLQPWAQKVQSESGGRLRIQIFPAMQLGGAPPQLFDQARDGVADIIWTLPGNTPGRFPRIEVFELPFVSHKRAIVNCKACRNSRISTCATSSARCIRSASGRTARG
jgi:TRAP-type C4-dicarboxylate transport system substrate-binding protein